MRTYYCPREFRWRDKKTNKVVTVPSGYPSDGATGAIDLFSYGWYAHDLLCDRGTWDDGSKCSPSDASRVLKNILKSEGRNVRAYTWGFFTWLWTAASFSGFGKRGMRIPRPEKAGDIDFV